jgi:branched-chain amino acid transport system substrate-binding protein
VRYTNARPRVASLACLALALLLAACGGGSAPAGTTSRSPGASTASATSTPEPRPVVLGLDAPLAGPDAPAGEAIRRGMQFAIDELNGQGGIKGRPLELAARDDEGSPAKAAANARELVQRDGAVAVFAGPHTSAALAALEALQPLSVPLIVPWATGNRVVPSGRQASFAFRVSATDAGLAQALVGALTRRPDRQRPGVLVEESAWGEASLDSLVQALAAAGLRPAAVEKVPPGDGDPTAALSRLRDANADALLLLLDGPGLAAALAAQAQLGGDFASRPVLTSAPMAPRQAAQPGSLKVAAEVVTAQTYSFLGEQSIPGKRVLGAYQRRFGGGAEDIAAPVGVANAFDAVHLLARALRQVDDPASGDAVRQALENLQTPYEGLLKTYQPPFSADNHEALSVDDYVIVAWKDGQPTVERAPVR